jgi:hypothetical protein
LTAGQAVTSTQTLYVYAVSADNPLCTDESTFEITISDELILEPIQDVMACDSYTLPELAIGSYYTGPGATGEIIAAGTVLVENQQLWVYASIGSCTAEISFTVNIDSTTADQLAPVTACDSYQLQPLSAENNYYTGPGGTGTLLAAGQVITSTQTLYVYAVSADNPLCTDESTFEITINDTPVIDPIANVVACDSYILPALTVGNYYTATGGTGTMLAAGTEITATQTLFVYADNAGCIAVEQSFTVTIPIVVVDVLSNTTTCDSYILPVLSP